MTRDELLNALQALQHEDGDVESDHQDADALLLRYINDDEITAAFAAIRKWYA